MSPPTYSTLKSRNTYKVELKKSKWSAKFQSETTISSQNQLVP